MGEMLEIDGSSGEGGGQILRTSLALSLVTGKPFRLHRIRAKRSKPGLRAQHLVAVNAAAAVGQAQVKGNSLGSQELSFTPSKVVPGNYRFDIGTAGSATLVLQTIFPALMLASSSSTIELVGGTHNPLAPPFDFLEKAFVPLLRHLGPHIALTLDRPGFYPAGGGRIRAHIEPTANLQPLQLEHRGRLLQQRARAIVAHLPRAIAERELTVIKSSLQWPESDLHVESWNQALGPGNVLLLELVSEHVTEVFASFGERGVPAESVASRVAAEAQQYLQSEAAAGEYLADQLLVPLALAGAGVFSATTVSSHTRTNMETIQNFLPVHFHTEPLASNHILIRCQA